MLPEHPDVEKQKGFKNYALRFRISGGRHNTILFSVNKSADVDDVKVSELK
jgi:hypothetical protein